jgi:nitrite reductase/ring-hydroxylating ferredoxin subunit
MSIPEGFVRVARLADLRKGRGTQVIVGDHPVALWLLDGTVHAIDGICPHQHVPTMHSGVLEGNTVACPMHGWTFRLEDGSEVEGNGRIRTFRVLVEKGEVYVEGVKPSW